MQTGIRQFLANTVCQSCFSGLGRSNSRGNGKSQSPQQGQGKTRTRNRRGRFVSVTQSLRDEPNSLLEISLHCLFGGAQLSESFIPQISAVVATSAITRAQHSHLFIVLLFQATDHWEREKKARADVEKVKRKIEGDLKVRKRKGGLELFGLFSEGMI